MYIQYTNIYMYKCIYVFWEIPVSTHIEEFVYL